MANASRRVVIVGAGYAGLMAARELRRAARDHQVTLIDKNPYHTLETELWKTAATGGRDTLELAPLVDDALRLFPAEVEGTDLDAKVVHTNAGDLAYDLLLIAPGSVTNFFGIAGLRAHAHELKTSADARGVFEWFARAHHPSSQVERRVLVGGGGLTGVELAGELAERSRQLATLSGVPALEVQLIEARGEILPELPAGQRARALHKLAELGVKVRTHTPIQGARKGALQLKGETLTGGLIVWTGGVRAPELVSGQQLERGRGGRLIVDRCLELRGYPGVFAAGDAALAPGPDGRPAGQTAQAATQQGELAGRNLMARLEGRTPEAYRPSNLGELISLGRFSAVGWVGLSPASRLQLSGHVANLAKRASTWRHLWDVGELWP